MRALVILAVLLTLPATAFAEIQALYVNQGNGWAIAQRFDDLESCAAAARAYVAANPQGVQAGCAVYETHYILRHVNSARAVGGPYTSHADCKAALILWMQKHAGAVVCSEE